MNGTRNTTSDPQAIVQLERGLALVRGLTIDPDSTTVHVDHHVYEGRHSIDVSLFPGTVEARRRIFSSDAFAGAAWDFTAGTTAAWSDTRVGGVRVVVHVPRTVGVAA